VIAPVKVLNQSIHIRVRVGSDSSCRPVSHALSSHPPPVSTMASSQPPKGRDGVLMTLDVFIQALDIAKDACGVPPAQVALGSASVLLTMIRVCFLPLRQGEPLTHVYTGHDVQQSGLRRAWTNLCRCMPKTLPEIEGERIGWTQPVRPRCDWRFDYVSHTISAHTEPSAYRHPNRRTLTRIQWRVAKQGKRIAVFRFVLAKGDKDKIVAWKQDLLRVLQVFTVRLVCSAGHSRT
jgi:hypothetical protein